MFITKEELKSIVYSYQLDQITMDDDTLVEIAVETAVEEIKSYIAHRYDVQKAFTAKSKERSPLLIQITKVLTLHQVVQISNVDILYDRAQADYDRWIKFLSEVASGKLNPDFPLLQASSDDDTEATSTVTVWGSDPKLENNY